MSTTTAPVEFERDAMWGPMSHPATPAIEDGLPPWKDHIYLGFWDANAGAFGFFHWNSSPNHDTGKAQLAGVIAGHEIDIKDKLEPSHERFSSERFECDMRSSIEVDAGTVKGSLAMEPRLTPVDYTQNDLLPPLVPGKPLQHWQQGVRLVGDLTVAGETVAIDGLGYRTRTWGHRDDSNQFQEYVSIQVCYEGRDITVMKFRWPDGSLKTDGFVVTEDGETPVVDLHVVRNAAGLTTRLRMDLADGEELTLERVGLGAAVWCPIGLPEREGPTFSAYDEFIEWELDGERAYSIVEQAIVRHVF